MPNDAFAPPESQLLTDEQTVMPRYYVVSNTKLSVMLLGTFGLYILWWSFANWQNYKRATQTPMWPIARAIFSIFFTHSLFSEVNDTLKAEKIEHKWSPMPLATFYVIFSIAGNIADRLGSNDIGSPFTDLVSLILLPATLVVLLKAQKAINISQNDKQGLSNSKFTIYNILWLILGGIGWSLALLGMLDILGIIDLDGL